MAEGRRRHRGVDGAVIGNVEDVGSLCSKLKQARIDGEPYNSSGPSFTPDVVHGHDELTKRQRLLLLTAFHDTRLGQATVRAL